MGILFLFMACKEELSRHVVEYHENGVPRLVSYYRHQGVDSVLVREEWFYADSSLRMTGGYEDGLKSGEWIAWYENGNPWSQGTFLEGKSHGERIVYHENGQIKYKGSYTHGDRSGHWEFFDANGKQQKVLDY